MSATITDTITGYKATATSAAKTGDLATIRRCVEGLCDVRHQLRKAQQTRTKLFRQATDAFWFVTGLEEYASDSYTDAMEAAEYRRLGI